MSEHRGRERGFVPATPEEIAAAHRARSESYAAAHPSDADRQWAAFVAAQDERLVALGRPAGHDGAERGALPWQENRDLAESLGLDIVVAILDVVRPPEGTVG